MEGCAAAQDRLGVASVAWAGPGSPEPEAHVLERVGSNISGRGGGGACLLPNPAGVLEPLGWLLCDLAVELESGCAMRCWLLLLALLLGAALPPRQR